MLLNFQKYQIREKTKFLQDGNKKNIKNKLTQIFINPVLLNHKLERFLNGYTHIMENIQSPKIIFTSKHHRLSYIELYA